MSNTMLFGITTLIWGSTWLAIHYQVGVVAPLWSIHYRFLIAATIMLILCPCLGHSLRFNARQHVAIATQGILLCCVNFIGFYYGSLYLVSGLVALIAASVIIMNIINAKIFLKRPMLHRVLWGGVFGLTGLAIIFGSEISRSMVNLEDQSQIAFGLTCCLVGTYLASLGQTISYRNQMQNLPVMQTNALGMAYGAAVSAIIALLMGEPIRFDCSAAYLASLLYLSLVGSIAAFTCYLTLLGRIGAEKAAYTFVMLPVISLLLSSIFEDFRWHKGVFIGLILIVIGNIVALRKPQAAGASGRPMS